MWPRQDNGKENYYGNREKAPRPTRGGLVGVVDSFKKSGYKMENLHKDNIQTMHCLLREVRPMLWSIWVELPQHTRSAQGGVLHLG